MSDLAQRLLEAADECKDGGDGSGLFLVACKECFDNGQQSEVLSLLSDEKRRDLVRCVGWDLIGIVSDQLNDESNDSERDIVLCNLMTLIGRLSNARELCLCVSERLTQTLHAKCIANLVAILECALVRLQDVWPKMLKSARPVIIQQLESFYSSAESDRYESDEEDKSENDKARKGRDAGEIEYDKLLLVLQSVEQLSCRLVTEAFESHSDEKLEEKRRELGVLLVHLLGIPVVHCQLKVERDNSHHSTASLIGKFAVNVMALLFAIRFRAIKIMEFSTQKRTIYHRKRNVDDDIGEYYIDKKNDFELPPLACGCFSYLLLVEGIEFDSFPSVYHSVYLLRINLPLIIQLLIQSTKHAVKKGILLLMCLVERVNDHELSRELLSETKFLQVAERLIDVMIYNSSRELRKHALSVLPRYFAIFIVDARYKLLLALLAATDHSGVASLLIHEAKEDVIRFIDCVMKFDEPHVSITDIQRLFDFVFSLKAGKSTDLLQELDRVMAALNLLRFVLLKDKRRTNVTGVWSHIEKIEQSFLTPMRELLAMTKTDWQHEIEKSKHHPKKQEERENQPQINIRLCGGKELPYISRKQQTHVAHSALVSLDMLESVLARVCDIIDTS